MSRIRVIPIVEGHGEVQALPILLRRIWVELLGGQFIDVLTPIRGKRDRLIDPENADLCKAIQLANGKARDVHREAGQERRRTDAGEEQHSQERLCHDDEGPRGPGKTLIHASIIDRLPIESQ